jgi:hypothetical protein
MRDRATRELPQCPKAANSMAAGTMWNSAFVSLFGIKRRWFGVVPIYLQLLDVGLSDPAKDLFLVAN